MKLENIIKLKLNNFEIVPTPPVVKGDKPVDVQEAENIKKNGNPNGMFADYPWDQCVADQLDRGYDENSANNICGWIKANYQEMAEEDGLENACWPGYEAIGTKELDGRIVPNCVPIKEEQSKEKFIIPEPSEGEDEQAYISRCISSIIDEYGQEQAAGICYGQWEKK